MILLNIQNIFGIKENYNFDPYKCDMQNKTVISGLTKNDEISHDPSKS